MEPINEPIAARREVREPARLKDARALLCDAALVAGEARVVPELLLARGQEAAVLRAELCIRNTPLRRAGVECTHAAARHQEIELTAAYIDPLIGGNAAAVVPYIFMLVVLVVRPTGMFGWKRIERV